MQYESTEQKNRMSYHGAEQKTRWLLDNIMKIKTEIKGLVKGYWFGEEGEYKIMVSNYIEMWLYFLEAFEKQVMILKEVTLKS
jgi:hypothetical protein